MIQNVKITAQPEGRFWNLKVGCVYQVTEEAAEHLIKGKKAVKIIETAMAPTPGVKIVRKDQSTSDASGNTSRSKKPPASDR